MKLDLVERDSFGDSARQWKIGEVLVWLALLLAFSPVLHDLAEHWRAQIWSRYSLSFVPLLLWCVRCDRRGRPLRWLGFALVGAGLVVELLAALAVAIPLARPALAAAVIGLLLMRGLSTPATALLALWVIPVPHFLVLALDGAGAVKLFFETGGALLSGAGLELIIEHSAAASGDGQLPIDPVHGGLLLLVHMTGLGWYRSLRRGSSRRQMACSLTVFAVQAVPIQFAAILLALLALGAGAPALAGVLLDYGSWLVPLLVTVYVTERPDRSR